MNKFLKTMKRFGYISIETVIVAAIMIVAIFTFLGSFVERGQTASNDAASKIDDVLNLAGGGEGAGPGGSGGGAGGGEIPEIPEEEVVSGEAYALVLYNSSDSSDSTPMIFVRSETPIAVGDTYNSKTYGELRVRAAYGGIEELNAESTSDLPWYADYSYSKITSVTAEDKIAPINMCNWFNNFQKANKFVLDKIDTSNVSNMGSLFYKAGYSNTGSFEITGLDKWDISNVTNMRYMFSVMGTKATTVTIEGLEEWDTFGAVDMYGMFQDSCLVASNNLDLDLSGWDISNANEVNTMFNRFAQNASGSISLNVTGWSFNQEVTSLKYMFNSTAENASSFKIIGLETWDVSNIKDMQYMFNSAGSKATDFIELDLSNWDVSKANVMTRMFNNTNLETIKTPKNIKALNIQNITSSTMYDAATGNEYPAGTFPTYNTESITLVKTNPN